MISSAKAKANIPKLIFIQSNFNVKKLSVHLRHSKKKKIKKRVQNKRGFSCDLQFIEFIFIVFSFLSSFCLLQSTIRFGIQSSRQIKLLTPSTFISVFHFYFLFDCRYMQTLLCIISIRDDFNSIFCHQFF